MSKPTYDELLQAAQDCRAAQKAYYERDKYTSEQKRIQLLVTSKEAERALDKLLAAADTAQVGMFEEGFHDDV